MPKKDDKNEKIEIDKDFLMKVLKSVEEIKKEVDKLKKGELEIANKDIPSLPDHIFQCIKLLSIEKVPPTPQDMVHYQQIAKEFEKKLEALMREFKIIQLTAMFLKKL